MDRYLWLLTGAAGAWLLLWKKGGDRWGWLGMLNAWAEWSVVFFLKMAVLSLGRRQWALAALAAGLATQARPTFPLVQSKGSAKEVPGAITLFSANLYKYNYNLQPHIDLIRQHRPDIICVQELHATAGVQLEEALGDAYPNRIWYPLPGAYGLGILSKYPIEESGYWMKPGVKPWGLRALVTLPQGQKMEVYNVHLVPPTGSATLRNGMTWGFRTREEQITMMQQEMAQRKLPALVIGDHNFSDANDAYQIATAHWKDAWCEAGEGGRLTWPTERFPFSFLPWSPRMLRLDYCFYNEQVEAHRCQVVTATTGSDHCPLVVTVSVK